MHRAAASVVALLLAAAPTVAAPTNATGAEPDTLVIERRGDALVAIPPTEPQRYASAR